MIRPNNDWCQKKAEFMSESYKIDSIKRALICKIRIKINAAVPVDVLVD